MRTRNFPYLRGGAMRRVTLATVSWLPACALTMAGLGVGGTPAWAQAGVGGPARPWAVQSIGPNPSAPGGLAATKGGFAVLPQTGRPVLDNPFPSGVLGAPQRPASNQDMAVNGAHISQQVATAVSEADQRLAHVAIGSGDLSVAPLAPVTLDEDIRAAERIHRMEVKQAEVQSAVNLWGAAYDGKRETQAPNAPPPAPVTPMAPPVSMMGPVRAPTDTAEDRARKARDEAEAQSALVAAQDAERQDALERTLAMRRAQMAKMMPVTSSIAGSPDDATATVLVPYVGQQTVSRGDKIHMFDGSILDVTSVTDAGVMVSGKNGRHLLDAGSYAPSPAQVQAIINQVYDSYQPQAPNGGPSVQRPTFGRTPSGPAYPTP